MKAGGFRTYRQKSGLFLLGGAAGAREMSLMKKEMKVFGYFGRIATFATKGSKSGICGVILDS